MGPDTAVCALLQDPATDDAAGVKREWLNHGEIQGSTGMNVDLPVNPAGMK